MNTFCHTSPPQLRKRRNNTPQKHRVHENTILGLHTPTLLNQQLLKDANRVPSAVVLDATGNDGGPGDHASVGNFVEQCVLEIKKIIDTIAEEGVCDLTQRNQPRTRFCRRQNSLINLVHKLLEQLSHDIMVPFGKATFFPGRLIHTNEFLVLLGEGYYAERTSKQTVEILQRRGKSLDSRVDSLEANIKDPEAEASFLNATASFLVARFFWEKGLPSGENTEKILRNLLAKEKVDNEVEFKELATMTEGYTGSDLKNLCTNATYRPVRELIHQERLKSL
ncbi:RNA polymerase II subunit 5-mediating protein-like isoform C [Glycine soja]|nr:RNA polymerase II subunit 5-mediating protein-like isoform B [Glycine soja]RZB47261.1 RNA polymerase II subunit 5-mediating protein-like isoform C [Glycine soja]